MSLTHSFSADVAIEYSVDVAVMLNHFGFWYKKNRTDDVNFYKGDYWVRMKASKMHEYYPYFTLRQLRYLIDKMIDLKLLKQDEFNDKKNDRTKWYCLTKKSKKILNISTDKNVINIKKTDVKTVKNSTDKNVTNVSDKIVSLTDKNVTSILKEVDIKDRYIIIKENLQKNLGLLESIAINNKIEIQIVKDAIIQFVLEQQEIKKFYNNDTELFRHFRFWVPKQGFSKMNLEKELNWFIKVFNQISKREFYITEITKQRFAEVFAVGYSGEQMSIAIKNLYSSSVKNKWHKETSYKFATPEYLLKDDNMGKYLNLKF